MKTTDPNYVKSTVTADSFSRLGIHAFLLFKKGASLGLLADILHMKSYSSVYKLIIGQNSDATRGNRRRPPFKELELITKWEQNNPAIAAAMKQQDISPRRWCCLHDLVTSENNADFFALIKPEAYEWNTNIPVKAYLLNDFPSAFGLKAVTYWPKDVDPDQYCHYQKAHINNKNMHILTLSSLGIKVMNKSFAIAFNTFSKRLRHEVSNYRMIMLLEGELNEENINAALSWLPNDISKSMTPQTMLNQGKGNKMMRELEEAARLRSAKFSGH